MKNRLALAVFACGLLAACHSLPEWMGGNAAPKTKLSGERLTVLPEEGALAADASLKTIPVSLPPMFDNADWPQHTGWLTAATANLGLSGSLEKLSSSGIGEGDDFDHALVPEPVTGAGKVFAMDAEGNISAHGMNDISTIYWRSPGVSEEGGPDTLGGGLAYDGGNVYAVSGRGVVTALRADSGAAAWRKELHVPFRSAPAVADGKIFALTIDSQLFALDATTGEALWTHRGISETTGLMNPVSPVVAQGAVIVPYGSGEIYALAENGGNPLWAESLAPGSRTSGSAVFTGIGGNPVVDGEVVFAVSAGGKLAVMALASGQKLWERPIASLNTPWVAGDYIFVLTADNQLAALVKYNGHVRWAVKLPSFENEEKKTDPILWRGPVLVGGRLAVIGSNERLLLIDAADGTVAATKEIPGDILTAPIVAGGKIYLVGQDATLYSLQ